MLSAFATLKKKNSDLYFGLLIYFILTKSSAKELSLVTVHFKERLTIDVYDAWTISKFGYYIIMWL